MNKGIQKIFGEVPRTYELVNHILTFGMDIIARRKAARMAVFEGGTFWLDACSGTGEMAANLVRLAEARTKIFAADFSAPMLAMAARKPEGKKINFVISDVGRLPFPDNSFDLITISFATRNINTSRENLIKTVAEFRRILKPGGRYINLETSQPSLWPVRKMMHIFVRLAVNPIGRLISGSKTGYAYLSQTIPRFYPPEKLASIIIEAGFAGVTYKRLFGGGIAIHKAVK
jgi:demethylmenaquinone methyltransferase / 2-methoxy-6-polyprenyl-1,4-benzoquinol methylase